MPFSDGMAKALLSSLWKRKAAQTISQMMPFLRSDIPISKAKAEKPNHEKWFQSVRSCSRARRRLMKKRNIH